MTLIQLGARAAIVAAGLAAWFWTQSLIGSRKLQDGIIGDRLHDWTAPWNAALHRRPRLTNGILIATSACIDLFALFLIGAGVFGATWRPFIALLLLFVFRQSCQALCALPVPPGMIWRYPGFRSLLVTYGVSNDFFISGHTAIAVLGAIEIFRQFPLWAGLAAALVALLEAVTVIVLRAHYTMDVLGAITAAFCAAAFASQLCTHFGI